MVWLLRSCAPPTSRGSRPSGPLACAGASRSTTGLGTRDTPGRPTRHSVAGRRHHAGAGPVATSERCDKLPAPRQLRADTIADKPRCTGRCVIGTRNRCLRRPHTARAVAPVQAHCAACISRPATAPAIGYPLQNWALPGAPPWSRSSSLYRAEATPPSANARDPRCWITHNLAATRPLMRYHHGQTASLAARRACAGRGNSSPQRVHRTRTAAVAVHGSCRRPIGRSRRPAPGPRVSAISLGRSL